jgi:hypothetical protein
MDAQITLTLEGSRPLGFWSPAPGTEGLIQLPLARPLALELGDFDGLSATAWTRLESNEATAALEQAFAHGLDLELPSRTHIHLELVGETSGLPVAGEQTITFWQSPGGRRRPRGSITITGGQADFLGLEPELAFSAAISGPGLWGTFLEGRAPGPDKSASFRVVVPDAGPLTMTGRLTNSVGADLVRSSFAGKLNVITRAAGEFRTAFAGTTSKTGRFTVETTTRLPTDAHPESLEVSVRADAPDGGFYAGGSELDIDAEFRARLAAGRLDLGEIRLDSSRALLAGRVVDAAGAPLPGVRLFPRGIESRPDAGTRLSTSTWTWGTDATSDAAGHFALHLKPGTEVDAERLALVLEAPGYARADPLESFPVGAFDVTLRLTRAGQLEGRVEVESIRPDADLTVQLVPADELTILTSIDPRAALRRSSPPYAWHPDGQQLCKASGTFGWTNLVPGSYSLGVFLDHKLVVTLEGLEVIAGETSSDMRILSIDPLEGRPRIELGVLDAHGTPVPEGLVWQRNGGDLWAPMARIRRGRVVLRPLELPVDVMAVAPGLGEVRVLDLQSDRTVRLESEIDLRLALGPDVDLHGAALAGVTFVRGLPIEDAPQEAGSSDHPLVLAPGAELHIRVTGPGEYEFQVMALDDPHARWGEELFTVRIRITSTESGQLLSLEPPQD